MIALGFILTVIGFVILKSNITLTGDPVIVPILNILIYAITYMFIIGGLFILITELIKQFVPIIQ